jgi:type IV secretory pathway VirB4 component
MLRLDKAIKPWKEAAALCDHINLYGFWNETAFLTKSGDLGMVLSVGGVDYESLDHAEQEYAVKRLEAALKAFGPGFHVYQYLFKSNRPEIPWTTDVGSLKRKQTGFTRSKSITAFSSKAHGRRPASAQLWLSFSVTRREP